MNLIAEKSKQQIGKKNIAQQWFDQCRRKKKTAKHIGKLSRIVKWIIHMLRGTHFG